MMLHRFRDLVEEHQHRVFTFAYYYLGRREEAEDVTQEVLLRLWRHIESVEPDSAGAWLARVTRNACYDLLRSRRSRKRLFRQGLDGPAERVADGAADTEAVARGQEARQQIERALAEVAEPYRTIVILRELQGYKYQEISDTMEMPLNTVKTYLHRGRRMLREQLTEAESYA